MRTCAWVVLVALWATGCGSDPKPPTEEQDMGTDAGPDMAEDASGDLSEDAEPDAPQATRLMINEVSTTGELGDGFELYNPGPQPVALLGYSFTDDLVERSNLASFPAGLLVPAGGHLWISLEDTDFGFGLGGDEELGIYDPDGELLDSTDWEEGEALDGATWGRFPDGTGTFKTLFSPTPGEANQDNAQGSVCGDNQRQGDEQCDDGNREPGDGCDAYCRDERCGNGSREGDEQCDDGNREPGDGCDASCLFELTPGAVLINEVAASSDLGEDWIELYNAGQEPASLSGWSLLDDEDDPERRFVFGAGVTLEPGAWLWLDRGGEGFGFGLGARDQVRLFNADGVLVDAATWDEGQSPPGASWGRLPDGGAWETLFAPSPGYANLPNAEPTCANGRAEAGEVCDGDDLGSRRCADLGFAGGELACQDACASLDASACQARPEGLRLNEVTSEAEDLIELVNTSQEAASLSGWSLSDSRPELEGHLYLFPEGRSLEPGEHLVLRKDQHLLGLGLLDQVVLRDDQGQERDRAAWRYGEAQTSFCRLPDAQGPFVPCGAATPGAANAP